MTLIDGHDTYKPAENRGCANQAVDRDPPREHPKGHSLSVPQLIRGVYGDREVKIIAVLREPGARLHAAFWNYEHYRNQFGASEDSFDVFAQEFMDRYKECAAEHTWEGCAHRFEAYGAKYEAVFYHADQLIKSLYATFLEGWLQMFGRENVLALRAEDVFSDSESTRKAALAKAVAHLGLEEPTEELLAEMDAYSEHQQDYDVVRRSMHSSGEGGEAAMHPETRAKLDAFFGPQKEALAAMFGDDSLRWSDASSS